MLKSNHGSKIQTESMAASVQSKYLRKSQSLARKAMLWATLASSIVASNPALATSQEMLCYTQLGEVIAEPTFHTSDLKYRITAVKDETSAKYVVYEVNGKTDKGYWYQVGLTYDKAAKKFLVVWEGFDDSLKSFLPGVGGGFGKMEFKGVKEGDSVVLGMTLKNGKITLFAKDETTNKTAEGIYKTASKEFVGTDRDSVKNFFTGPMTEILSYGPPQNLRLPRQSYQNLSGTMPDARSIAIFQQQMETKSTKTRQEIGKLNYQLAAFTDQPTERKAVKKWPMAEWGTPAEFVTGE